MKTEKTKGWIARERGGALYLYREKPYRSKNWNMWDCDTCVDYMEIDPALFPEVKWEAEEPTEVEMTLHIITK